MIGGCVNWALMVNMTMYTCLPKRRSTANAVQMFTGHILGKSLVFLTFKNDEKFLRVVHTQVISFLKSMSERVGSDVERL